MEQKNERAQEVAVQGPVQQAIRNRLEEGKTSSKGWKRSVLIIIASGCGGLSSGICVLWNCGCGR